MPARSVPRTCISRISAVASGLSTPCRSRYVLARRSTSLGRIASVVGVAAKLVGALRREQRVDERVDPAGEHVRQPVHRHLDAVIGDAALGEVVGADLLGALTAP